MLIFGICAADRKRTLELIALIHKDKFDDPAESDWSVSVYSVSGCHQTPMSILSWKLNQQVTKASPLSSSSASSLSDRRPS